MNSKSTIIRKISILRAIDTFFFILAYPHIRIARRIAVLSGEIVKGEFIERGLCGGCAKYGTKSCRQRSRNPYAYAANRNCYTASK